MDSDLLDHIRLLLEDTGTSPVVTDVQITNLAKPRRRLVYYEALVTEDYLTWYYEAPYIETTVLADSYEGTAFEEGPSGDYTADPIEGTVTFDVEQSSVYLKGYIYDLLDIVANCWLVKAGILDAFPGLSYSLGDESVDKGGAKEYCISQYWRYRTSKGGKLRRR
jgi:hypothetical protein